MKKLIAILTVFATLAVIVPQKAEAQFGCQQRVVGHTNCGRPVMAFYQIVGYDRCGNPIGQWITQSSACGCNRCSPRQSFGGHSHGGFQPDNRCAPPPFRGSQGGFSFRFGR